MLFSLIFIISSVCVVYYYWPRRHLYTAASKIKGPPGFPIIGNALSLAGDIDDIFDKLVTILDKVGNEPSKLWLGPILIICLKNPEYLEKIMTSQKFSYKHEIYEIIHNILGDGLVTASGLNPKYKKHRKTIQPMFDLKFIKQTNETFQKYTDLCLKKMEQHADMQTYDVMEEIHKSLVYFNFDVFMGLKTRYEDDNLKEFIETTYELYDLGFERMAKVWLHPDFIYDRLPRGKEFRQKINDIRSFVDKLLIQSDKRRKLVTLDENGDDFVPIIDRLTEMREKDPSLFSQDDLIDHLLTLTAAAEDPVALVIAFAIVCFGMYPEIQQKAIDEIRSVVGDDPKAITLNDLYQLKYLDMCVKDVSRLFPAGPFLIRRMVEDYQLHQWLIPKGAAVLIAVHNLHRDPQYWKHPNEFYPEHFLPEEVTKRHPYTLLSFSAGPRGCIGKNIANVQLKQFLASFLLKFEIEADGKVLDFKLKSDVSVRSRNGYKCRIKKRFIN